MKTRLRAAVLPLCAIVGALIPCVLANARPDPADPAVPVPAAIYQSPMRDDPVRSWRQTNDRLWPRGAEAMADPASAPAQPGAAAASAPAPSGHGHAGHHMK